MAGPWERYAAPAGASAGPWAKYGAAAPAETPTPPLRTTSGGEAFAAPPPPPGVIIHGADRSYISDQPGVNVQRRPDAAPEDTDRAMTALQQRGESEGLFARGVRAIAPLVNGISFGFGDDLVSSAYGATKAAGGEDFTPAYNYAQELQAQEIARQREENPIKSLAAEAGGGLATGLGLAKSGVSIVGQIPNEGVRNIAPRMVAGALEGSGYAALSGYGNASGGAGDRLNAASENVPMGAVLGAAGVPIADLLSTGARAVSDIARGWRAPDQQADQLLIRRMMQDRTSPGQIAGQVEEAGAAGQPDFRAVDAAGRNTKRLAAMAVKTPGEFRDTAPETLGARYTQQPERLAGYVDDAVAPGGTNLATQRSLEATRRANAETAFTAADAAPPPFGQFYDDMLARPSVQDAMRITERTAAENQMPISDLFTEIPNPSPTTRQVPQGFMGPNGTPPAVGEEVVNPTLRVPTARGWRMIKQALDRQVDAGYASPDAAVRANAEAVKETRNALRGQLQTDNPAYGDALRQFGDDRAAEEALELGGSLVRSRGLGMDTAIDEFGELAAPNQQLARVGASREIGAKLTGPTRSRDGTQVFNSPDMERKLDVLAQDPVTRALLRERVAREQAMVRTDRAMTGGSITAENLADGADLSGQGGALASLLMGRPIQAAGQALGSATGSVARGLTGLNEEGAQRVGQYVMQNDPTAIRSLSDLFLDAQAAAAAPPVGPSMLAAGANAPRRREDRR